MALSPSYLDSCPAGVVSLWQQCEDDILRDMARKIRKYNFYIPSSQWQENRLKAGRQTRKDIVKTLSKYTGMSQAAVNKLIQESAQLSVSEDVNAITRGDAYKVGELDRAALNQILRSSALQTNNAISNICATTANTATQQFERALDRAWMQVSSGAFSLDTAVERACLDLANSGISAIQYAKKADTIEVAVRRAVRTGVNQTALKLTGEICEQLECDLVEVSAHAGARPEHEAWQGQIYSRSGKSKKYPPFTRTGYGTGAGLGGWNCRHSFAPYVEGSPRAYDDAKLQSFKEKTRTYNGHELTEYEATQYQRALERDLRRYKRQQLAGVNGAQEKLDAANARLDDYCKQTGLKRQYSRDDVVGWNGDYKPASSFKPVNIKSVGAAETAVENTAARRTLAEVVSSSEYVRFGTVKDAEEYAEKFVSSYKNKYTGNVSLKGMSADAATSAIAVLDTVFSEYDVPVLGNLTVMNFREKRFRTAVEDGTVGSYQWGNGGTMFLNHKILGNTKMISRVEDDAARLVKYLVENEEVYIKSGKASERSKVLIDALRKTGRNNVGYGNLAEETIVHECGHMLDDKIFGFCRTSSKFDIRASMKEYSSNISGYATADPREYVAESFTCYWYGETDVLDPELVKIFEEFRK